MPKLPAIQFYFGDWKKDPRLAMCSLPTRGFWFELLGAMHELDQGGQITGTLAEFARLGRCTLVEAEDAIAELNRTKTADVVVRNEVYTVINRRMKREAKTREMTKKRVAKFRLKNADKRYSNDFVTPMYENVTLSQNTENNKVTAKNGHCNAQVTATRARSSSFSSSSLDLKSKDLKKNTQTPNRRFSVRVSPEFEAVIWEGIANRRLDTSLENPKWQKAIEWAFARNFSAEDFLGCLDWCQKQPWRKGRVTAEICENNLAKFVAEKPITEGQPDWQKAIENCPICDEKGLINGKVCRHERSN